MKNRPQLGFAVAGVLFLALLLVAVVRHVSAKGCAGEPSLLEGPDWDRDGDGLSTGVELDPLNAEYCLDTLRVSPDPSQAVGLPWDGSLSGGLHLPTAPEGAGYYHEPGGDAANTDDWGTSSLIALLEEAGRCWLRYLGGATEARPRLGVLDLGLQQGGRFPPHKSHQNGRDVDVRYVRSDGKETRMHMGNEPGAFDEVGTLELMLCFSRTSVPVELILVDAGFAGRFEDWTGGKIRGVSGHRDHFHVRIAHPDPAAPRPPAPPPPPPPVEPADPPPDTAGGRRPRVPVRPQLRQPLVRP